MPDDQVPPHVPAEGDPEAAVGLLEAAAAALLGSEPTQVQVEKLGDLLVRLQAGLDAAAGAAAEWALVFEEAGGHEQAGHPTMAAWARQELRATAAASRKRATAAVALRTLPDVREAAAQGSINAAHVDAIAHGVRQLGPEVMGAAEQIVLDVAKVCDADAVRVVIGKLRDTLDPDAADAAYLYALEKRDITLSPVGDGYAVHGFLDPETGAAFSTVLSSLAKPDSKDDDRPAGHRRVDALRDLCTRVLAHGLPTDRGLRPQLYLTVSHDRLNDITSRRPGQRTNLARSASDRTASSRTASARTASDRTASDRTASARTASDRTASSRTASDRTSGGPPRHHPTSTRSDSGPNATYDAETTTGATATAEAEAVAEAAATIEAAQPAVLDGFGPVSDRLVGKLACDAVITPVLIRDNDDGRSVLDVGRSSRLATLKQRQAVFTTQDGSCAAPGCTRTHLELHHLIPWAAGGRTDLANLAGYCTRCHHLIHLGLLIVRHDPDTGRWQHRRRSGQILPDHRRQAAHTTRRWTHALLDGGLAHADHTLGIRR